MYTDNRVKEDMTNAHKIFTLCWLFGYILGKKSYVIPINRNHGKNAKIGCRSVRWARNWFTWRSVKV